MTTPRRNRGLIHAGRLVAVLVAVAVPARAIPGAEAAPAAQAAARDGRRDFDFEIGSWQTRLRRLLRPLTGSTTWVEYRGTTEVRKALDGDANLAELDVSGSAGRIQGLSLRLYDPESRQWSLNYASKSSGALSPPVVGEFKSGRGEFFGLETLGGRTILARFVIEPITRDSIRFEQAYSDDAGRTWEVNWIAVDTRVK